MNSTLKNIIKEFNYDLETIIILRDNGKIREITPIIIRINQNIKDLSITQENLAHVFNKSFWDAKSIGGATNQEVLDAFINQYAQENFSTGDFTKKSYLEFISKFIKYVQEGVYLLKINNKTPQDKFFEIFVCVFSAIIVLACLAAIFYLVYSSKHMGLKGDFYAGRNFENFIDSGFSSSINFSNIKEINFKLPAENCSVKWQGVLIVPEDGNITFFLRADDGVRFYLDDNLIMNYWKDQTAEYQGVRYLKKGRHKINIEYYNHLGDVSLNLYWKRENGQKEIISNWYLRQS